MKEHFSDEKMFYKIGEVCEMLNLNASQLRFWEKEFDQLNPKKNSKGDRLYKKSDIETIQLIHHLLKEKGYTVPGAKEAMENQDEISEKVQLIEKLKEIKVFLENVKKKL
jgi:DNA-binding transcriptional MerR regulator